jgi:hypothetical protein
MTAIKTSHFIRTNEENKLKKQRDNLSKALFFSFHSNGSVCFKPKNYLFRFLCNFVTFFLISSLMVSSILPMSSHQKDAKLAKITTFNSYQESKLATNGSFIVTHVSNYNKGGRVEEVKVRGDYAFLADGVNGLKIIDISDPTMPLKVGNYYNGSGAHGVTISDNHAYLTTTHSTVGIEIIDISDPENPTKISSYYDGNGTTQSVVVSGNYAYNADLYNDGLEIINVTDQKNPTNVGNFFEEDGLFFWTRVQGNLAYILKVNTAGEMNIYGISLEIINVSNPVNPIKVGSYRGNCGWPLRLAVCGDYVYLAASSNDLEIIDVSNPCNPHKVGEYFDRVGETFEIIVDGNNVFVLDDINGLEIYNVKNPANPLKVGQYLNETNNAYGIAVDENYAYIANGNRGLEILALQLDTDGDGLSDAEETTEGKDGYVTDQYNIDSDDDGFTDLEEVIDGEDGYITNPLESDTDGDGYSDSVEVAQGTDPTNKKPHPQPWLWIVLWSTIGMLIIVAILFSILLRFQKEQKKSSR